MRKSGKYLALTIILSQFLLLTGATSVQAIKQSPNIELQTPSFITVEQSKENNQKKIIIKGKTPKNTKALIYLDGSYQKSATIIKTIDDECMFKATIIDNISQGKHTLTVISQNKNSKRLSPPVSYSFRSPAYSPVNKDQRPDKTDQSFNTPLIVVPSPTIINPNHNSVFYSPPVIKGFTLNNTRVIILINGQPCGKTEYLKDSSGTAYFEYTLPNNLKEGAYNLQVMAENKENVKSKKHTLSFFIVDPLVNPLPAPIISTPNNNEKINKNELTIKGLAQSGSIINLYIDDTFVQSTTTFNNKNLFDKAEFSFTPDISLLRGAHSAYVKCIDPSKKLTSTSSSVSFNIIDQKIGSSASTTNDSIKKNETKTIEKKSSEDISATKSKENVGQENNINKNRLSYLILSAIIIAIVFWLAWVNRRNSNN